MPPPDPTVAAVRSALNRAAADTGFQTSERAVRRVFDACPANTDEAYVLAKVVILNRLYSTNIYAVHAVAAHITALDTDARLDCGDPSLVNDIARVRLKNKTIRFYSFATKYCAWHEPDQYQIYDERVNAALWEYAKSHTFAYFKRQDLRGYPKFVEIVDAFRTYFALTGFTRKQLDIFLWYAGEPLAKP